MKITIKVAWMWRKDVFLDMWNHGCLLGIIGVTTKGMPVGSITSMCLDKATPAVDRHYLYIGLLLFYIRFIVEFKSTLNPVFVAPEHFDENDDETGEYNRKMQLVLDHMIRNKYPWRSVASLASDLEMDETEVSELLEFLVQSDQVVRAPYFGVKSRVKDYLI